MAKIALENLPPLNVTIDALMYRHGSGRVLLSAVTGLFRAATLRRDIDAMSDQMRKDIGLAPKALPPSITELLR